MSLELEPETILHPQPTATSNPSQAPVLSTPDTHLFEDPTPTVEHSGRERYTHEQIRDVYEIERTAREVVEGGWRRVALQFPDFMLRDAVSVFEELGMEIEKLAGKGEVVKQDREALEVDVTKLSDKGSAAAPENEDEGKVRFYILADTSYNACCVDEIAAEHADADVVVHYGRSCLSPTKTLPVLYVFTSHPLDMDDVVAAFEKLYLAQGENEKKQKIVIMADIIYHNHVAPLAERLRKRGWTSLMTPEIQHDPDALIPNRKLPEEITAEKLQEYKLFHISTPPNALVMILYSRLSSFAVYPTSSPTVSSSSSYTATTPEILTTTKSLLNRRYALLSHIATQPILGILINTLSHTSTTSTLLSLTQLLRKHGKKYYTFVVGKVNAAKMANFAEIGGWIVVGCWEGGLFDEGGFYRGTVTPYEVELGLKNEGWRIRGGEWRGGLSLEGDGDQGVQDDSTKDEHVQEQSKHELEQRSDPQDEDSEDESSPPEYDFRTGRYITSSHAKTTKTPKPTSSIPPTTTYTTSLAVRAKNTEIASINGVLSPGAEFLKSQRTWQGLGSDFAAVDDENGDGEGEGGRIEEGRRGVARGYVVGRRGPDGNEERH